MDEKLVNVNGYFIVDEDGKLEINGVASLKEAIKELRMLPNGKYKIGQLFKKEYLVETIKKTKVS